MAIDRQAFKFDFKLTHTTFLAFRDIRLEVRRFVAIVPYKSRDDRSVQVLNSLLNSAVLLFWFAGAALFTVVRIAMHSLVVGERHIISRTTDSSRVTVYMRCLASVLGNTTGLEKCAWRSERLLLFVVGVFATFASMLFSGALFEQLMGVEPPRQINTLAELAASNLTYREWHLEDVNFM